MVLFKKNTPHILSSFEKALNWIRTNTLPGEGIIHSSTIRKSYPEVTGYYIPSLLNWGEKELAFSYGDWLCSIQTPEGAWKDTALATPYSFDTGQILKGLYELSKLDEKYKPYLLRGCDWLARQIKDDGELTTPDKSGFSRMGSDYIHLYALEPLKVVGETYNSSHYIEKFNQSVNYYLSKNDLIEFNFLSHFHAYIVEALIDIGKKDWAVKALEGVRKFRKLNGNIPAYKNVNWVCSVALLQYAVSYYKLGLLKEGNKLLDNVIKLQNKSGGFYGGYGFFVHYFKKKEISWAPKYLLDAIWWRIKLEFESKEKAELFLESIDEDDGRYMVFEQLVLQNKPTTFLDIGCGKGRYLKHLLPKIKDKEIEITGMDVSNVLFKYLPKNVKTIIGNILSIPLATNSQDFILCAEALEHAVNIRAAIKELYRVTSSKGTVLIIDKDVKNLGTLRLEPWEQWFDVKGLKAIMEEEGFITQTQNVSAKGGADMCAWIGRKE